MTTTSALRISDRNDTFIVELSDEFSHLYESLLGRKAVLPLLAESIEHPRLVIDMTNVEFIGSAAIGHFVTVAKKLGERGGSLSLANASSFCRAAIRLSSLDSLMSCVDSLDQIVQRVENR